MINSLSPIEDIQEFVLQNQQKEIRAYDQKAGYYIASNTGVFVIALFTLCIFDLFNHGSGTIEKNISRLSWEWWVFFLLTLVYTVSFCVATIVSILILFPRSKFSQNEYPCLLSSITNFENGKGFDQSEIKNETQYFMNNIINIQEEHIRMNKQILHKKHSLSLLILPFTIIMCATLSTLMVLLFTI